MELKCRLLCGKKDKVVTLIVIVLVVSFVNHVIYQRFYLHNTVLPWQTDSTTYIEPDIVFESCKAIPRAPNHLIWPEEEFIHDKEINDTRHIADPFMSRAWTDMTSRKKVGDVIDVHVELRDGFGNIRHKGGDLVRVWMRELPLGAASVGTVTDHGNGSYTARLEALWVGRPEVRIAIISPREVIAAAFRRRYMCPPVLMNTGIFKHPVDLALTEETPCSYDAHVPGYDVICNFTEENYRRPWYCGKPRHSRLMCHDWVAVGDINLWVTGNEKRHLSEMDQLLLSPDYSSRILNTSIKVTVERDVSGRLHMAPAARCGMHNLGKSWIHKHPVGFMYNKTWTSVHCKLSFNKLQVSSCFTNTTVKLIGDSTLRQMFEVIQNLAECKWVTESWGNGLKHRPAMCQNSAIYFSLTLELPPLPFCTRGAPRHFFKSFTANLNSINDHDRVIVVLHAYSHLLNYQSHVLYDTIKDMKTGIINLLNRNKNAIIVVKGPHSFAFSKSPDHVAWMPDIYASMYVNFIFNEFKDLHERVLFVNPLDITIATEQWHIHAEYYVIEQIVHHMLDFIC